MNKQPIDYNTRFSSQREQPIGEGIETTKGAKATTILSGDAGSQDYTEQMLYRQRAKNNYQGTQKPKNLAYGQLRN